MRRIKLGKKILREKNASTRRSMEIQISKKTWNTKKQRAKAHILRLLLSAQREKRRSRKSARGIQLLKY